MSLFNGLWGIFDEKFFALAVPALSRAGTGARGRSDCGRAELFMRMSLASFPIFRKKLLALIAGPTHGRRRHGDLVLALCRSSTPGGHRPLALEWSIPCSRVRLKSGQEARNQPHRETNQQASLVRANCRQCAEQEIAAPHRPGRADQTQINPDWPRTRAQAPGRSRALCPPPGFCPGATRPPAQKSTSLGSLLISRNILSSKSASNSSTP